MKITLNRLAICFVGISLILFALLRMGFPVLGLLKTLPLIALLSLGIIIIIAALKKD
jgi:hypothetical protein